MGKTKDKMHPKNIFRESPNYTDLAIKYRDFRLVCILNLEGTVYVDYKKEKVLRALSKVLLEEYFGLTVEFAPDSLVPTVPLRLNYMLWISDLVAQFKVEQVKGIDIGCGSACIYSLLAAKQNNWQMLALESHSNNIEYAQRNVKNNNLHHLINIHSQKSADVIFADYFATAPEDEKFQFCVCNPPFYDSTLTNPFNSKTRDSGKRPAPHNCRTGNKSELLFPGGEVKFVENIIEESLQYAQRICIFTSMIGIKRDLAAIVEILKDKGITNYCTTSFCQGFTTRWFIAWSLMDGVKLN